MINPIKCCGENPIIWKCTCNTTEYCGCDVEKIECGECGRIVWGADPEEVERWNTGETDD